ncbi:hypothetical protein LMG7974_01355 [Campylobacter majalis]|uniref:M23 family metallopeptidase n=1 Tax=Campylobacter majalis TaxID=2790656 RepID=A0ABN7K9I0_9BACT|nr:peptidoglycan DD-metalloendopeptidase family protein [Campylobacter majalis]CAD7289126.1 hypothetical protein LMG7974_01355 [Campylobacter majalis]
MIKILLAVALTVVNLFAIKASVDELRWSQGMTFLSFLGQNSLPSSLYYNLTNEDKESVAEISAGLKFHIFKENDEILQILIPVNDELQIHIFKDGDNNYQLDFVPISYQTKDLVLNIEITKSISEDITSYVSNALANAFKTAFKNQNINYKRIQKGDRVTIFYTQKFRMGMPFGTPELHSAMLQTQGKTYTTYKFENKYYNKSGKEERRVSFVRPLPNARITSGFTLKRWHPVYKRYRAHLGVDYGAPRGTPVKASGDGSVKFVGTKNGYGKTIILSHQNGYETLYAHLNGFAKGLKTGQKVKQGTLIGYVGSTGVSTGPHLHFGFYIGDKPVNPENMMKSVKVATENKNASKFKAIVDKYTKEYKKYTKENLTTEKYENFQNVIEF